MSLGPVRPRFRRTVHGAVGDRIAHVVATAAEPGRRCVSRVVGHHVDITVIPEDRHRWSPCVHLEFNQADADTTVDGLVGPHPNVWTLFAFVNGTIAMVIAFGLMLGLTQWSLEQSAWGLWAVPAGAGMLGVTYLLSQIGQRCAAEQTALLMRLVEEALGPEPG